MLSKVPPAEIKYNAWLISNQYSTHIETTCVTNQLTGLKYWLEVGQYKINKSIKLKWWLESIFNQAGKMQEQFKYLHLIFKPLWLTLLSFRKVAILRNPLHVLHAYFALVIISKFVLLTFVKNWFH